VLSTLLWVVVSLVFKFYIANFADYNATYGAVGGVVVLLLWFYISGLAILVGAEMNAEIEHASPWGKDPGEKVAGVKKKIGAAAARAYKERLGQRSPQPTAPSASPKPVAAFQAAPSSADRKLGLAVGLPLIATRLWNRFRQRRHIGT
jgi:membrane protein